MDMTAADDSPGPPEPQPLPYARRTREYLEVTVPIRDYFEALRAGDAQLRAADDRFQAERDRRYAEVNVEKEKALKIKETADLAALQLAREIQTYKDEKANELREQISRERGLYATRDDLGSVQREIMAVMKPLSEYVTSQQGSSAGTASYRTEQRLNTGSLVGIAGTVLALVAIAVTIIIATRH